MPPPRRTDPPPHSTDGVGVVTAGTVVWFVCLGLALLFRDRLADGGNESWIGVLLAGSFLGLPGIRYVRRRRNAVRRDGHAPD